MKFTGEISKINEQGVKAKEDNPYPTISENETGIMANMLRIYREEAEVNRKEYEVSESYLTPFDKMIIIQSSSKSLGGDSGTLTSFIAHYPKIGDRIEGDIINSEIINVKVI